MQRLILVVMAVCGLSLAADQAGAQSGSRFSRPSSRAFDNVLRRPSVSPYLNLINRDPNNFDANVARYQNLVRPQIDSFNRNARTQSQIRGLQRQVQQVQSTAIGGVQNATQMGFSGQGIATGHPSLFQYTSRFYPALGR
jgi:hypothetical protein